MEPKYEQESTDALMAALYPAEDDKGVGASAAEAALDSSLASELDSYRSLRSMFESFPEEEPPSSVNAKLLAAAGKAAASFKTSKTADVDAGPSLVDRILGWFEPLRAHPGLAALASLVLVASIGGVLLFNNKTNKDQLKPENTSKSEPAQPRALAPPPSEPPTSQATKTEGTERSDEDATRFQAAPAIFKQPEPTTDSQAKDRKKGERGEKSKVVRGGAVRQPPKKPGGKGPGITGKGTTTIDLPVLDSSVDSKDGADPDKVGEITGSTTPSPDPAPPAGSESRPAATLTKKQRAELGSLKSKARGFAKNSDCTSVKKLGKRVEAINAGYFDGTFLTDDDIRRCYQVRK